MEDARTLSPARRRAENNIALSMQKGLRYQDQFLRGSIYDDSSKHNDLESSMRAYQEDVTSPLEVLH
jgi:hypothetical protein